MWVLLAFLILVVIPVALRLRELPRRLRDVRAGLGGLVYVPGVLVVLTVSALGAVLLSEYVPLLQWGWLGTNIVAAPLADLAPQPADSPTQSVGGGSVTTTLGPTLTLAVFVPVILLAFVVFNYYEEAFYRDSLRDVAIWAVLHLVMGIPLFAVIPIFVVGLVYKAIHDRRGVRTAYVAHLGTNCTLMLFLVVTILFGPAPPAG